MKYQCPSCSNIVFNRRLSHCEFCSAELPAEFILTDKEIAQNKAEYSQAQLNKSRQRVKKELGVNDVLEENEISFFLGEPSLRARASRQCIKCELPISEDYTDCPHCFGKSEPELERAKVTYSEEMKSVQHLGKYFIFGSAVILAILSVLIFI